MPGGAVEGPGVGPSFDILVVGAGVLGLASAAELTARGRRVAVVDPGGPNASSIAAGMIAPALEAALEGATHDRAALLRAARDLWPAFAARTGVTLGLTGAEWRGDDAAEVAARLRSLGFAAEADGGGVFTPDDWQIEPGAALAALAASLAQPPLRAVATSVEHDGAGWRVRTTAGDLVAPHLVLATGVGAALEGLPAGVRTLIEAIEPIRGQIGRVRGESPERALRTKGAYLAPAADGFVLGATMEAGERATAVDPASAARMTGIAAAAFPEVDLGGEIEWRAAVRGASPDGLPLAGPSGEAGLHLALAPRRNGWLLAPLVARIVADGVEGRAPGQQAPALDPRRFF